MWVFTFPKSIPVAPHTQPHLVLSDFSLLDSFLLLRPFYLINTNLRLVLCTARISTQPAVCLLTSSIKSLLEEVLP